MVRPHDDFTRMVEETLPELSRYALRRAASSADAEEVVAETYAIAWRRRWSIPAGDEAVPWLYGVARRVLANQRRGGYRWERLVGRIGGHRPVTPLPGPAPDSIVERQPVLDALARLAPADAEVLRLISWEQLSHAEVALALGTSENAVALRASRARRKLVELLAAAGDRPGTHPDMEGRAMQRRNDAV